MNEKVSFIQVFRKILNNFLKLCCSFNYDKVKTLKSCWKDIFFSILIETILGQYIKVYKYFSNVYIQVTKFRDIYLQAQWTIWQLTNIVFSSAGSYSLLDISFQILQSSSHTSQSILFTGDDEELKTNQY